MVDKKLSVVFTEKLFNLSSTGDSGKVFNMSKAFDDGLDLLLRDVVFLSETIDTFHQQ